MSVPQFGQIGYGVPPLRAASETLWYDLENVAYPKIFPIQLPSTVFATSISKLGCMPAPLKKITYEGQVLLEGESHHIMQ